jgi:hypothetical protein
MSTAAVSSSSLNQQIQQYFQTRRSDLQQLGQALNSGDLATAQTEFNNITTLGQSGPFASGNAFALSNREQDFNAIGAALQSGDLATAQQAFATLQSTFQRSGGGTPTPIANPGSPNNPAPVVTAAPTLTPIASSPGPEIIINLSSGTGSTSTASSAPTSSSTTSTGTSGPEIVLNLGNGSSTPEQITISLGSASSSGVEQLSISVGNQQNPNAQEVTLNLNANSDEEIVLNLAGPSATSPASSTSPASTASAATTANAVASAGGGISVSA